MRQSFVESWVEGPEKTGIRGKHPGVAAAIKALSK